MALIMVFAFTACSSEKADAPSSAEPEAKAAGIDYMALVNKLHPLPDGWEDALKTVHMTNVAYPLY